MLKLKPLKLTATPAGAPATKFRLANPLTAASSHVWRTTIPATWPLLPPAAEPKPLPPLTGQPSGD